jgi:hypothetical protein
MTLIKYLMAQYNLEKLEEKASVELTWHGEDTRLLLEGASEKIDVKTGDTVKVTRNQAKKLLSYSHKWTFKGEKPVEQPYERAQRDAVALQDARNKERIAKKLGKKSGKAPEVDPNAPVIETMTEDDVDKMTAKAAVAAELKKRGVKANAQGASLDELKALLKDAIKPKAPEVDPNASTEEGEKKEEGTEGTDAPQA